MLHWASRGGPRPTGTTVGDVPLLAGGYWVLQTQGCTCGPENIGPPMGWFVIVMRAARPSASLAVSLLAPLRRPRTSPVIRPPPLLLNAEVTSRPSTSAVTRADGASAGRAIWTSASPPETRSARLDRTSIRTSPVAACAGPAAISTAANAQQAATSLPLLLP